MKKFKKCASRSHPSPISTIITDGLFYFSGAVSGFGFSGVIEFIASPQHATSDKIEIDIGAHRLVVMPNRRAEDFALSDGVGPNASMIFLSVFAKCGCQCFAVGPHLVNFIELPIGCIPDFWESLHDGMFGL